MSDLPLLLIQDISTFKIRYFKTFIKSYNDSKCSEWHYDGQVFEDMSFYLEDAVPDLSWQISLGVLGK